MRTLASDTDPQDSARLGEELWQTVFANPHIGMALIGPDRRFRKANERFRELVGYTEEELRRLTVLEITHPEAHTLQVGIPNERGADRVRDPERSPRLRPRIASFCVRRPNRTRADMPPGQKPRILLSSL
jgi:PAS domain-containing protein